MKIHIEKLILLLFLSVLISFNISASSRGLTVFIKDQSGKQVAMYTNSHALLIGVSDYSRSWTDLETIPSELNKVASILKKQGFNVTKVIDPNSKQLKESFENFIKKYGYNTNDRLLFFFSGHGYTRKQGRKGYLVPTDAPDPKKDENGFLTKALSMTQIRSWSIDMEAKHVLFLFDSCFSGTIFKTKALSETPPHINAFTARPVRQYITAGSAGEKVPSTSVFTPLFIRAIEGEADLNNDGYVIGTELGMFLNEKVMVYSHQQTPQFGKINDPDLDRGDFVFETGVSGEESRVQLTVKTNPLESDIFVNNKYQGTSPLELKMIPGTYTIQAQKKGFLAKKGNVRVKAGADQFYSLTLDKKNSTGMPDEEAIELWALIKDSEKIEDFQDYLSTYPNGKHVTHANVKIRHLKEKRDRNHSVAATINLSSQGHASQGLKLPGTPRVRSRMVLIPAGEFQMGSNNGDDDEKPVHSVYLDEYYIDQYEVTVAEYRKCVKSGKCKAFTRNYWDKKDSTAYNCNWAIPGRDNHPINCVDWYNAKKYCEYVNKRLPTEAEWEKAATWKNGRKYKYPSGKKSISCREAITYDGNKYGGDNPFGCGKDRTWMVGSKPQEINGTYDMTGNVRELALDWYGSNYYRNSQTSNPKGPPSGANRVNRGGSWNDIFGLRGSNRKDGDPLDRLNDLGFRCVSSP
jgi:formylglycine-generating enzyme required for sulfatase activity